MPQHVPPQNRVADLLDSLRVEFDNVNARAIGESNERNEGLSESLPPKASLELDTPF